MQLYQCHRDGADLYQCGVREQSLSAPRAAGMVKKSAWGFSALLFHISAMDYFSLFFQQDMDVAAAEAWHKWTEWAALWRASADRKHI